MWPFKTKQQKKEALMQELSGKAKRMEVLQQILASGRAMPSGLVEELLETADLIGELEERIRYLD